jgi:hypothetical protein|nr:MAG TPA: hypothetical protein [Caudoviricetes sp.]
MEIRNGVWYTIPDFPGYEVKFLNNLDSFTVRSFKNFNKNPNGFILKYVHKSGTGISKYYTMTGHDGESKRVTIEEIFALLNEKNWMVQIRSEYDTNIASRLKTLPADRGKSKKSEHQIQKHGANSLFANLIPHK